MGNIQNNFLIKTANDPLEQFSVNDFLFCEHDKVLTLWQIDSNCPYDIWTEIYNFVAWIVYYAQIFYGIFHYYVLSFLTSSAILMIFAGCLLTIVNSYEIEKTNHKNLEILPNALKKFDNFTEKGFVLSWFLKTLHGVVKTILKSNTSLEKKEYFSILYFLFLFITLCNVGGLIPYTFTLTSSFVVTFFLAATHFVAINIIAVYKNNWNFFNMFLPSGVPLVISPFLVIIELISYIAKVFSLSIRLFANMMAGHALLKILIGFSWMMLTSGSILFCLPAILPWVVVTAIIFLEILIAFLQSYVFTVLVAIYINDVFNAH